MISSLTTNVEFICVASFHEQSRNEIERKLLQKNAHLAHLEIIISGLGVFDNGCTSILKLHYQGDFE